MLNGGVELLTVGNLCMFNEKFWPRVITRSLPGVTVFGYPAGRNAAEIACRRAFQGFSLNRRLPQAGAFVA